MRSYHRVHMELEKKDWRRVAGMLREERESVRVLRRAAILHQLDSGQKAAQLAANMGVTAKAVRAEAYGWLIAQEAARRKLAPPVNRETIRILLESHDLKPWQEKTGVSRKSIKNTLPAWRMCWRRMKNRSRRKSRWFAWMKSQ